MGKKLLIQFMIVWGVCVSAHAREQQACDTSTVMKMNRLYDRVMNGDIDIDTSDLESLRESEIIRLVNSFLDIKEPKTDVMGRATWVLYNIRSERVRECYVMWALAEKLDRGDNTFIDHIFTDMDLCSVSEKLKNRARELVALYEPLQPGKDAPDFELESNDGKTVRLNDLQGKPLFIEVWKLDSASCRKDLVRLEELKSEHKNVQFVTVVVEPLGRKEAWKQFLRDNGYEGKGIHLFADENAAFRKTYRIKYIPRCILLDAKGKFLIPWCMSPRHEYFPYFFSMLKQQQGDKN